MCTDSESRTPAVEAAGICPAGGGAEAGPGEGGQEGGREQDRVEEEIILRSEEAVTERKEGEARVEEMEKISLRPEEADRERQEGEAR